jgi:hypothetical protein
MYHIFQTEWGEYFLISGSDRHWSVEHMSDLSLSCPYATIPAYSRASLASLINERESLGDTYVCSVDSLEDLPKLYPEEFI